MTPEDIKHRFAYHAPTTAKRRNDHASVRELLGHIAQHINDLCPDGREKSLAITHLEEAMFWANAALAREVVEDGG